MGNLLEPGRDPEKSTKLGETLQAIGNPSIHRTEGDFSNSDLEVSRLDYTQDHVFLYTLTIFVFLVVGFTWGILRLK